jgi:hypothetical protein
MAEKREPDHQAVGIGVESGAPLQSREGGAEPSGPLEDEQAANLPDSEGGGAAAVDDLATAVAESRNDGSGQSQEEVEEDLRGRLDTVGADASDEQVDELAGQVTEGEEGT